MNDRSIQIRKIMGFRILLLLTGFDDCKVCPLARNSSNISILDRSSRLTFAFNGSEGSFHQSYSGKGSATSLSELFLIG